MQQRRILSFTMHVRGGVSKSLFDARLIATHAGRHTLRHLTRRCNNDDTMRAAVAANCERCQEQPVKRTVCVQLYPGIYYARHFTNVGVSQTKFELLKWEYMVFTSLK